MVFIGVSLFKVCSHFLFFVDEKDVKEESIKLADETLKFAGKSEGKEYEVDIVFFKPVDAEGSTYKVLPRSVQMHVMKSKKDEDEEFWPRLLKDKALEKNQVCYPYGGSQTLRIHIFT